MCVGACVLCNVICGQNTPCVWMFLYDKLCRELHDSLRGIVFRVEWSCYSFLTRFTRVTCYCPSRLARCSAPMCLCVFVCTVFFCLFICTMTTAHRIFCHLNMSRINMHKVQTSLYIKTQILFINSNYSSFYTLVYTHLLTYYSSVFVF